MGLAGDGMGLVGRLMMDPIMVVRYSTSRSDAVSLAIGRAAWTTLLGQRERFCDGTRRVQSSMTVLLWVSVKDYPASKLPRCLLGYDGAKLLVRNMTVSIRSWRSLARPAASFGTLLVMTGQPLRRTFRLESSLAS